MLICIVLSLRIKLQIIYEDELKVYLRILFLKIQLLPDDKKRFKPSKLRKKKKDSPIPLVKDIQKADPNSSFIIDKLNSVREIISIIINTFHKRLHVKLTKIYIRVATADAAQTAILYGGISTAVACIIDILDDITNLQQLKDSSISIEPDFLSEKTEIKLNILLYISAWGAIKGVFKSYIKYYTSKEINNRKEN